VLQKLKVSHPERIIDSRSGHTKLDLVRYYDSVAEFMLPHLARRPVALVRAPGGVGGPTFFQKHGGKTADARRARTRPRAVARPRGAAGGAHARRAAGRGADERHRVPHLELDHEAHDASPTAWCSTSTPAKAWAGRPSAKARCSRARCCRNWACRAG
jgi:hypothetical protein